MKRKKERKETFVMSLFRFLGFLSLIYSAVQLFGKYLFCVPCKSGYESASPMFFFFGYFNTLVQSGDTAASTHVKWNGIKKCDIDSYPGVLGSLEGRRISLQLGEAGHKGQNRTRSRGRGTEL